MSFFAITAKRFHKIAQGCRAAATLGTRQSSLSEPRRGSKNEWGIVFPLNKRLSSKTTLPQSYGTLSGFTELSHLSPRVAAARQPWAILCNRVAVKTQETIGTTGQTVSGSCNSRLLFVLAVFAIVSMFLLAGCKTNQSAKVDEDAAKNSQSFVESGPVRMLAKITPVRPRLSDTPTLTIIYDYEEGVSIVKPEFGKMLGRFKILDIQEPTPKLNNGRVTVEQILTLEPTEAGRLRIDPIPVTFGDTRRNPKNQETLETKPLTVEVTSLFGEKTPTLTDLRGPAAPVRVGWYVPWWAWVAVAVFVVAVLLLTWLKYRKRREIAVAAVVLTPEDLANRELDALAASGLAATDVKQFFVALTLIVRRYIERTKRIRAPEQTTEEFLREVSRTKTFDQDTTQKLRYFLESADLVKFAAHHPNPEDVDESIRRARAFVAGNRTTMENTQQ
jgi:hypothetical protein